MFEGCRRGPAPPGVSIASVNPAGEGSSQALGQLKEEAGWHGGGVPAAGGSQLGDCHLGYPPPPMGRSERRSPSLARCWYILGLEVVATR
jgi:hypothetical protein